MKTQSLMFLGYCAGGCKSGNNTPSRGGMRIQLDSNDDVEYGEMVCLECAEKLAKSITKRAKECREKMAQGLIYRNDKWIKLPPVSP